MCRLTWEEQISSLHWVFQSMNTVCLFIYLVLWLISMEFWVFNACPTHILLNLQLNSSCFAALTNGILILISVAIVDFYSRIGLYILILYLTNLLNSHVSSKRFFFYVFLGVLCVDSNVVYEYKELYFFFLSLIAGSCPD